MKKFALMLLIVMGLTLQHATAQFGGDALDSNQSVVKLDGAASYLKLSYVYEATPAEAEELMDLENSNDLRVDAQVDWVVYNANGTVASVTDAWESGTLVVAGLDGGGNPTYEILATGTMPTLAADQYAKLTCTMTVTAYDEFNLPYEWGSWTLVTDNGNYI